MRKLGGSMAFISGLLTLVFGIIGLLVVKDVVHWHWAVDFTNTINNKNIGYNVSHTITFIAYIILGAIELMLGYFALKKARGFASFILLLVFITSVGFGIFNGIHSGVWGTTTIVTLSINGVASLGLLLGIAQGDK